MSKLWAWVTGKAWPFVKTYGKYIVGALVLLAVYLLGKGILAEFKSVALTKVDSPQDFVKLPGDEAHVLVRIGAGWQAVPVPGGEASKVTAVQVTPGGAVKVQKNNATLDTV